MTHDPTRWGATKTIAGVSIFVGNFGSRAEAVAVIGPLIRSDHEALRSLLGAAGARSVKIIHEVFTIDDHRITLRGSDGADFVVDYRVLPPTK